MKSKWIILAALMGLTAVGAGAFGAHGLKTRVTADKLRVFEVAVRYQMYHALALLAVAHIASSKSELESESTPSPRATAAGVCMTVGVVFFSGSLYALTFVNWKWLGPITPLGGVLLMTGWLLLALTAARRRPTPQEP